MRLYDYTKQFVELEHLLVTGEIDYQLYTDTLKSMEGDANEKAENLGKMIDNLNAQVDMFKAEEERLKKRRKSLENNIEWLTGSLELYLNALGKEKYQVGMYRLGYRKLPDIVDVVDDNKVPDAYKNEVVTVKVDKNAIKKALKDGEVVTGAELITDRRKFEVKK